MEMSVPISDVLYTTCTQFLTTQTAGGQGADKVHSNSEPLIMASEIAQNVDIGYNLCVVLGREQRFSKCHRREDDFR